MGGRAGGRWGLGWLAGTQLAELAAACCCPTALHPARAISHPLHRTHHPPTHPPQIDLRFMADLAALVPVVPVLAKADTMTGEELKVGV